MVMAAGLGHHRFLIGSGGGQQSQGDVVLRSAFGQPLVGGSSKGIELCSGFYSAACPAGGKIFLPVITGPSG